MSSGSGKQPASATKKRKPSAMSLSSSASAPDGSNTKSRNNVASKKEQDRRVTREQPPSSSSTSSSSTGPGRSSKSAGSNKNSSNSSSSHGNGTKTLKVRLKHSAAGAGKAEGGAGRGSPTEKKIRHPLPHLDRQMQQEQQRRKEEQRERERKPQVLLHELAAQKYSAFLADSLGQSNIPPLSYFRRPRRKRQHPDMAKAMAVLRVPQSGPMEGTHVLQFAPEWRKPMTIEPEQLGAFFKPGGGVIEPTYQPPPELKLAGLQGKDLNQGYLNYVEPDTTSSTSEIAEMLDETPGLEREEESAHFITYRNNLNKILVTPYSKQKWEMEIFKEGGVIYLEVVMVDRNRGKMDRTSYWGRRFETLCVLGVEGARLDELHRAPDDPARSSYCGLYRSRLGNHNILMGAEIDACRPNDPGRFVEIKTTRIIRDTKDEQIFKKHKTLKYWAQCYLAGVGDLVVGYRDDHGIVRDVKPWTTDGLVEAVDKNKHWDKDVCLNFADRCLSFLKDNVDEGPRYAFRYLEPFDQLTLEQIRSPAGEAGGPGAAISLVQGGAAGYMERYE